MAAASFVLSFRPPVPFLSSLRILRSSSSSSFPLAPPHHSLLFFSSSSSSPPSALTSSPLFSGLLRDPKEDDDALGSRILEAEPESEPEPVCASLPSPKLSVKEKKELASYAHSLGKKLKSQQVGKSGVTPSVATSFIETLEANELLKLKVHSSCPGELIDVISQLEKATGSVAIGQIGRTVILYRPSLSKMKKREAESTRERLNSKPIESYTTRSKMQKKGQFRRASSNHLSRAA